MAVLALGHAYCVVQYLLRRAALRSAIAFLNGMRHCVYSVRVVPNVVLHVAFTCERRDRTGMRFVRRDTPEMGVLAGRAIRGDNGLASRCIRHTG